MSKLLSVAAVALGCTAISTVVFAADPLVGTWKLDAAKSTNVERSTSQTETITATADGYTIKEDIEIHPGAHHTMTRAAIPDGKPHKVTGVPIDEAETFTRQSANAIQGTITLNGKEFAVETLTVSPDGGTLTWTTTGKDEQGKEQKVVAVYERQ